MQKFIDEIKLIQDDWMCSEFHEPASESEIAAFERENGIVIPQSYKDFLVLSDGGELFGAVGNVWLYGVKATRFKIGDDFSDGMVPKDFLILGFHDSQHICFMPERNKFLFYEYETPDEIESECLWFDSFYDVMEYLIDVHTG